MNTKSLMCTIIKSMSLRKTQGFDVLVQYGFDLPSTLDPYAHACYIFLRR